MKCWSHAKLDVMQTHISIKFVYRLVILIKIASCSSYNKLHFLWLCGNHNNCWIKLLWRTNTRNTNEQSEYSLSYWRIILITIMHLFLPLSHLLSFIIVNERSFSLYLTKEPWNLFFPYIKRNSVEKCDNHMVCAGHLHSVCFTYTRWPWKI